MRTQTQFCEPNVLEQFSAWDNVASIPSATTISLQEAGEDERIRVQVIVYDEDAARSDPVGLTTTALERIASLFVGLPVLDRAHETDPVPGREIGKVVESRLEGRRIVQVHEWWGEDAIRAVREGIRQGFSISWSSTQGSPRICSVCGNNFFDDWCGHKPGQNGCRILTTDAKPLEVTRTYAPVVDGTQLVAVLRRIAMGQQLGAVITGAIDSQVTEERGAAEVEESVATAAGIDVATLQQIKNGDIQCPTTERLSAIADALAVDVDVLLTAGREDGCEYPAEEPTEDVGEPAPAQESLRQTVDLRVAKLERQIAEVQRREARANRLLCLREYRDMGYLSGNDEQMLNATEGIPAAALRKLMQLVTPSEPRLAGMRLSDGRVPSETPRPRLRTGDDLKTEAEQRAEANGTDYLTEYRALRKLRDDQVQGRVL